jgi:6-pyruvoyltetrahydropterin/6-carboxytetrahydropterin synthase
VVDFVALRDALKAIVDELDHRMLLPTSHPQIRVTAGEREVKTALN